MLLESSPGDVDGSGYLEGRYANYFIVGHNAFEFIIDFGQSYEGNTEWQTIHSRIITSPFYAKGLLKTLQDAIVLYEAKFGRITDD